MGFIKIQEPGDLQKLIDKVSELEKVYKKGEITKDEYEDQLWAYAEQISKERENKDGK